MQTNQLTANEVAEACGNNESRIFRISRLIAGYWKNESWYVAAQLIANEINGGADPAGTLNCYLTANNL